MDSTLLFSLAFWAYLIAAFSYLGMIGIRKAFLPKAAFSALVAGFALHTVALFVRWFEAGAVELAAYVQAHGAAPTGMAYWNVYLSHPPLSNLYESLVAFGWGMGLVALVGIRRFKLNVAGLFASILMLLIMGGASLLITQDITPLVPALQSKWLHIHVLMAVLCYPAFGLAAILAMLYLLRRDLDVDFLGGLLALGASLMILSVGQDVLLLRGEYSLTLLAQFGDKLAPLTFGAVDVAGNTLAKATPFRWPMPTVGGLYWLAMILFFVGGVLPLIPALKNNPSLKKPLRAVVIAGFVAFSAGLVAQIVSALGSDPISLSEGQARGILAQRFMENGQSLLSGFQMHLPGPYTLSLRANVFEFLMLLTAWLSVGFYLFLLGFKERLLEHVPDADTLDHMTYRSILFAYPFLTMLIVTGAVWAYYAWGRYWGWDPKETWSLITWIVYSIYLHMRLVFGWQGKPAAVLSVIGFVVVIFTYLGVNLLLSGLHSYGSM